MLARWSAEETAIVVALKAWGYSDTKISYILTYKWSEIQRWYMAAPFVTFISQSGRTQAAIHSRLTAICIENPFLKNSDGTWNHQKVVGWALCQNVDVPLLIDILQTGMSYLLPQEKEVS
jgi:hypothetical protein